MTLILTLADISPDTWSKPITDQPQVVGRSETADIHLESRFVSKEHCRFWMEADACYVEDCGSTNGTYVRGERIGRTKLGSGDRVVVGNFELLVADESQLQPTDYEIPSADTILSQETISLADLVQPPARTDQKADDERHIATTIHQRLTPSRRIGLPGMLVEVAYVPSGLLGGDSFECFELNDRWVLALFDSMNHGAKAALTIALIRSELQRWVSLTPEPGRCLELLNSELLKLNISDLYICASLAVWFPITSTMVYATAGQHPPIWIRDDEQVNRQETAGGFPLGVADGAQYEEQLVPLRPKDRIFFFSDGLADAFRGSRHAGSAATRFAQEILRRKTEGLQQQVRRLVEAQHGEIRDDALLVACEVGGASR